MAQLDAAGDGGPRQRRAVLLGIEHPRAVAALRSLARAGIEVLVVEHDRTARGLRSRYAARRCMVDEDPEAQLPQLERLGQEGGGVLMATNDHYLLLVARHHDRLARHFVLTTPPWDVLEPVIVKAEAYRIAARAGIATPSFSEPQDEDALQRVLEGLDFANRHYVLKTRLGTAPADPRTGRFTRVAGPDRAAVEAACRDIRSRGGRFPMIEEVVPAEADRCIGVTLVAGPDHKAVLAHCIRRLALFTYSRGGAFVHPYEMGANVYCESFRDPEALDAARRFVEAARYSGPVTVEFRRSSLDDRLTFIKADPRFVRATSLSTALGLDMATTLYRVATGQSVHARADYPEHYAWVWLSWYASTLWRNRREPLARRQLLGLIRNIRNIKAFAYLDWRDPMPFLVDVGRLFGLAARQFAHSIGRSRRAALPASQGEAG